MSKSNQKKPVHPGSYIKNEVIPADLTVKDAAKILGVGRPALSNLLNENASLSAEMALRIEKAFGVSRNDLLQIQAERDQYEMRELENEIVVRTYAPSIRDIHARQIEAWADEQIEARSLLPAFIRRLVNTTGQDLSKVDFPAYDNSQRHGWDGQVEAESTTPWIPLGKSGWEFGVNKNPGKKAEDDYSARVASVSLGERQETTFIFVTPRNWVGKNNWVKLKKETGEWKDVRAYDASDLEQWLEQSVPAQSWFGEILGLPDDTVLSLDGCWQKWASVSEPELNKELFSEAVEKHTKSLKQWVSDQPERPLIVAADSYSEGLAFLVCIFEAIGDSPSEYYDRVVAVYSADALRQVSRGCSTTINVIASPEAEEALAGLQKHAHTIIVRHKGSIESEPDIDLDILSYEVFKKSLLSMGVDEQEVERFSRESGQSPTILRRRLSQIPSIKFPAWTQDNQIVRKLIPLIMVGVWDSKNKADQDILLLLSNESQYKSIEETISDVLKLEHSPLWSIGTSRGVISKIDTLFASKALITQQNIEDFFSVAKYVLSEDDPSLDLPEDDRWAAAIYEKTRNHSNALRNGICETLVLLSVNGNNLLQERLGINIEMKVDLLMRSILKPLNPRTWLSQQNDLPGYAEASPDEFLDILEEDLDNDDPQILTLLQPAGSGVFGGCPRSGLLWALELLAWKPERLVRVSSILARLSKQEIDDNWANKPINSLMSIFCSWMPQTSANVKQRSTALEFISKNFPNIGWQLCIDQFDPMSTIGNYNNRPSWRNDAAGAGQVVTHGENYEFIRKALDIALNWSNYNEDKLGDLVERLQAISEEDAKKVWGLISVWNDTGPSDTQKAVLRERIRRYAFTRRGLKNLDDSVRDYAREVYGLLLPKDVVIQNKWLFSNQWVEESADELEGDDFDYRKRDERIGRQRSKALQEIWKNRNISGIKQILKVGNAARTIGWHLAKDVIEKNNANEILLELISDFSKELGVKLDECISGYLDALNDSERDAVIKDLIDQFETKDKDQRIKILRLLKCAPVHSKTWVYVEKLSKELQNQYWSEIFPAWNIDEPSEIKVLIDKLVEVDRPRAAFFAAHLDWKHVESKQLMGLLYEVATNDNEPSDRFQFHSHDISKALEILDSRSDVSKDELANLEFLYIKVLRRSRHKIPNLEKQIENSPQLFIQALALAYKRSDDGEDPPEWFGSNANNRKELASAAHSLLESLKRIPGVEEDKKEAKVEKLKKWLQEARSLSKQYAREVVGDHILGKLLSNSPAGEDGIWPCEFVREVLEDIASKELAIGMSIGVANSRGATWRGEGGNQERALAEKYRNWSKQLAFEYPYVSNLLEQIACSYDRDAERWDTESSIQRRTGY